jgi:uncharacterized OB-fold protein
MTKFDDELRSGNFVTSHCIHCKKIVWPPSDYCNKCFRNVDWRNVSLNGKLIEWSKKGNDFFCIIEFENIIRIIGKLETKNSTPKPGQIVKLEKCILSSKHKFFFTDK